MQESQDNSATPDTLPWAFVLDPAANARALSDVQRRGFEAARQLAERILPGAGAPPAAPTQDGSTTPRVPAAGDDLLQELTRSWAELTARVLGKLADGRDGSGAPRMSEEGIVSVDLGDEQSWGGVRLWLSADPTGAQGVPVELWLHNRSARPLGPIRMAVADLRTAAGETLAGDHVRFEPVAVTEIPARSARGFAIGIGGSGPVPPGSYSGAVRVEGVAGLTVPLLIDVVGAQS